MKSIKLYQAKTGNRYERLSEAMLDELDHDVKAILSRHFDFMGDTEYLNRTKLTEAFLLFLIEEKNPWKLARDLGKLRKYARDINRLRELEPKPPEHDDIPF